MMISFHNYNELHIDHIILAGLEEMRQVIWPMWPEGLESETVTGHTCIVKFRNTPWDLGGPSVDVWVTHFTIKVMLSTQISFYRTYKIIIAIFHLFQSRVSVKYLD